MDDDAALLRRIASGDRAAMRTFYERHSAPLHHFLRARLGDAFEAADVMQETLLEVWRSAGRYEGRSSARTWVYGIARNKAIDRIRRSRRTDLREPDETLPDDAPSPEAVIAAASDAARLTACLGALAPHHRTVVRLAFYDDLSYPEIAEVEGIPVGTVKTRIHHAKRLLLHCLTRTG
jgi:RNA polymerase sigma-70 factor (ECF subfamily)